MVLSFPRSHLSPSCCSFIPSGFCQGHCHCPLPWSISFPGCQGCISPGRETGNCPGVSQPDSQRRCRSLSSLLPALRRLRPPHPACPTTHVLVVCTPLPSRPCQLTSPEASPNPWKRSALQGLLCGPQSHHQMPEADCWPFFLSFQVKTNKNTQ